MGRAQERRVIEALVRLAEAANELGVPAFRDRCLQDLEGLLRARWGVDQDQAARQDGSPGPDRP